MLSFPLLPIPMGIGDGRYSHAYLKKQKSKISPVNSNAHPYWTPLGFLPALTFYLFKNKCGLLLKGKQDPVLTELEKIMFSYTHTFFKALSWCSLTVIGFDSI